MMTISDAQSCVITYNCQSDDSGLRGGCVGVGGWVCLLLVGAEKSFYAIQTEFLNLAKILSLVLSLIWTKTLLSSESVTDPLKLFVIVITLNQNKLARLSQAHFILERWDPRLPERSTLD